MLRTSTSEPILDLPLGVGTFILAPVVAAKGAIGARKHLGPDRLADYEVIREALNESSPLIESSRSRGINGLRLRTPGKR